MSSPKTHALLPYAPGGPTSTDRVDEKTQTPISQSKSDQKANSSNVCASVTLALSYNNLF
jgi:hypothetical protein